MTATQTHLSPWTSFRKCPRARTADSSGRCNTWPLTRPRSHCCPRTCGVTPKQQDSEVHENKGPDGEKTTYQAARLTGVRGPSGWPEGTPLTMRPVKPSRRDLKKLTAFDQHTGWPLPDRRHEHPRPPGTFRRSRLRTGTVRQRPLPRSHRGRGPRQNDQEDQARTAALQVLTAQRRLDAGHHGRRQPRRKNPAPPPARRTRTRRRPTRDNPDEALPPARPLTTHARRRTPHLDRTRPWTPGGGPKDETGRAPPATRNGKNGNESGVGASSG